MRKHWTQGFSEAVTDIRQKLIEEGFWGRVVTPRAQSITFGAAGEQSPAEKLGWFRRDAEPQTSLGDAQDRETAKEPKSPDHGIDL